MRLTNNNLLKIYNRKKIKSNKNNLMEIQIEKT